VARKDDDPDDPIMHDLEGNQFYAKLIWGFWWN